MGMCCTKPSTRMDDAHHRTTLILHAYQDLPETKQGEFSRKRRGSFVWIEHTGPHKRVRTNDMIECLEEYLKSADCPDHDKN